ncbi:FERM domain-containing protein 8 isoform X2 [Tachyglossus aculeatus]|uniref:FERM domain-containing protein 8 isoform X2 n=1 Tax=Tachyglossus aculeatus TaxID=9261 RepID=UPI0018F6EF12|nr:FERM domain-containing protein 8 isoform X2 [Tachyglossus aculeatus]
MDGGEGAAGPPGPADRQHRASLSSVGPRAADVLVYLVDDTVVPLSVENLPSVTAHDLHRVIRDALQLPDTALDAFSLWLISPLLEVQLKPKHQPYKVCRQWQDLLFRFTDAPEDDIAMDEPSLQFRRNVFFPKRRELQINHEDLLRLLFEEAKFNVLEGRYPCDAEDCEKLGGLVCRVKLGPYRPGQQTAGTLNCAFFYGEIDKPAQGFFLHRAGRKPVTVAINLDGVHVIDSKEKHVLLGLRFEELSWDHTYPNEEDHILWLEFDGESEGTPVNKLLKIYSKQAELMSGLIEYCIELNVATEPAPPPENAVEPTGVSNPPPPSAIPQRHKLRRQGSVICSRIQHLATIDYVDDGKEIKRVKPKRTTSFFSRQLSLGTTSYTVVQPTDGLEQG